MKSLQDISILMTSYNKIEHFANVENLTREFVSRGSEIVIVDDGSSDGSLEALQLLNQEIPEIILVSQPNGGSAVARNRALKSATKKYIVFLDFDDKLNIEVLEEALIVLQNAPSDLSLLNYMLIPEKIISSMPIQVQSPTFSSIEEIRDELFGAMGYWRYIYSRSFVVSNALEFTPKFDDVGRLFILDDLFWLLHNASMDTKLLIFPESEILYEYNLSDQDSGNWNRFRKQVEVFPSASLVFLEFLSKCSHPHDEIWLNKKILETTNNHLLFLLPWGLLKAFPTYVRLRFKLDSRGLNQNIFMVIRDVSRISFQCIKNWLVQFKFVYLLARKLKS
jgi:glycosyltransferase involved in cell wall biosynthesis